VPTCAAGEHTIAAARSARYLQTNRGRVALVSMTSTATTISMASSPVGRAPGRHGLSALRVKPYMIVSSEMMESLRKIHDALPPAMLQDEEQMRRVLKPAGAEKTDEKPSELSLFDRDYRIGDKPVRFAFDMNDTDLQEILKGNRMVRPSPLRMALASFAYPNELHRCRDWRQQVYHGNDHLPGRKYRELEIALHQESTKCLSINRVV